MTALFQVLGQGGTGGRVPLLSRDRGTSVSRKVTGESCGRMLGLELVPILNPRQVTD
jgi:hypothetical protein